MLTPGTTYTQPLHFHFHFPRAALHLEADCMKFQPFLGCFPPLCYRSHYANISGFQVIPSIHENQRTNLRKETIFG